MCVWCVCVLFVHLLEDDLRCLFRPHQVNHGGVQQTPSEVSMYKSHTTEEPLRRHRSGRYCQVLSSHSDQVGKLSLMLFPPHQRVCVVGHLLDFHVRLKLGFPFRLIVSEEGGDEKSSKNEVSEDLSLLSYTLRYVGLTDLGRLCQFGLR